MRPVAIAFFSILALASIWDVGTLLGFGEYRLAGKPASFYFHDDKVEKLVRAAAEGDIPAMKAAVAEGVDVNYAGFEKIRPLYWPLYSGNKVGFETLLDLGADPRLEAKGGHSLVNTAAGADDPDYLRILLDRDLDPNQSAGYRREPPIFKAIVQHRWPQLNLLLEYCYNLNWVDDYGITAAGYAGSIGEMKMAVYLIEQGLTHNLQRLASTTATNVNVDQVEAQRELRSILQAHDLILPPDRLPPINVYPPPSPPAYAKSCLDRRARLGLGPPDPSSD